MKRKFRTIIAAVLAAALCGCSDDTEVIENTYEYTEPPVEEEIIPEPEPIEVICRIDVPEAYHIYDTDTLHSEGVYMVNLDTDTVVVEKNPDKRLIPASLTKIMTAVVCLENIRDLSAVVECPEACFDEFEGSDPNFEGASGAGILPEQDNLTYLDCLYGLMLPSGCEAANIIAYNVCGGDIPAFIGMMNETAQRIGCKNTHFTNTHGLHEEENYSSARDMYLITRYAMDSFPEFTEISCTPEYYMPANEKNPEGYKVTHTNRMSRPDTENYYEGVKGIKTGSINEYFSFNEQTGEWDKAESTGVRGLIAVCEKDGYRYLLVTVASPFYNEDGTVPAMQFPFLDHNALFDWVFEEFRYRNIISAGDYITTVDVNNGDDDCVDITAGGDYSMLLPNSARIYDIVHFEVKNAAAVLNAPVGEGDEVGTLIIEAAGKTAELPLLADYDVYAEEDKEAA